MKEIITALFLTIVFTGISQEKTQSNQNWNCNAIAQFQSDLRSYHIEIKDSNENIFLKSTCSFNELPARIDSLGKVGYQLKYIYGVDGVFEHCLSYGDSSTFVWDSSIEMLTEINRTCATGRYACGFLGDKYFIFHSTKPTGLVREVFYYLLKED